jgi:diketogulonate reductase-like aldo/keto reductase
VLAQGSHIIPIPGTTRVEHLEENLAADQIRIAPAALDRLNALINPRTVSGPRYNAAVQQEIDTEEEEDEESWKVEGRSGQVST